MLLKNFLSQEDRKQLKEATIPVKKKKSSQQKGQNQIINAQLRIRGTASQSYCTKKGEREIEQYVGEKTEKPFNKFSYIFSKIHTQMQKNQIYFNMGLREKELANWETLFLPLQERTATIFLANNWTQFIVY